MKARYINPFTDFGFKKIFGEEASKPLLRDFLNALLPQSNQIAELSLRNPEQPGSVVADRKAVFDIYCENQKGEKFLVELQKARQNYFKERTLYYSTFPIQEQAERGMWDYNLKAVFCIGILDFAFNGNGTGPGHAEVVHTVTLKNQDGKNFFNKLTFIFLEMPNFNQSADALHSRLDQWLYFIKHLEEFESPPRIFEDDVFKSAFERAELARYSRTELAGYENSLKIFRDWKGVIETAHDEGKQEGIHSVARAMKKNGLTLETIVQSTGLTQEEIARLD